MPRTRSIQEDKKYVQTVPVKLLRAKNSLSKKNVGRMFVMSLVDHMFRLCETFGPGPISFMSNDSKFRVALGLAAMKTKNPSFK